MNDKPHQWIGPNDVFELEHCAVCMVIKNAENADEVCEGKKELNDEHSR